MLALGLGSCRFLLFVEARRKGETHGCSSLGTILCGDPPAMRFDARLADGQPDSHALLFCREERFEQPR